MKFKTVHKATVALMVCSFVLTYFRGPIVYCLFGFQPDLIGSGSHEEFVAFEQTKLLRNGIYYFAFLSTVACLVVSGVAIYFRSNRFLAFTAFGASLLLLLIFGIAQTIPTGIF